MDIKKRKLGQTDIAITPIGLGVMQFAGGAGLFRLMFPKILQQTMNEIVQAALAGGINWFDTAELYGNGRSERGLANALQATGAAPDEDIYIATKWSPMLRTARNIPRTISKRQKFLSPYPITLHQIHQPISFSSPEAEMVAMADLVEAGKIRAVGVSNFNADQMRRAHAALAQRGLPLASNQVQFSLIDRRIETNHILDTAQELGVTIIAWSPLGSGLLSGKFHKNPELLANTPRFRRSALNRQIEHCRPLIAALDKIAASYEVSAAQVALNWAINFHNDTVVAIPGASKVHHANQNAGAMAIQISEEDLNQLDELSREYR